MFAVYALVQPDTEEVRYVGVTTSAESRRRQHLHETEIRGNIEFMQWQTDLRARGLKPWFVVVHVVESDPIMWEQAWIRHWKTLGHRLVNKLICDESIELPRILDALEGRREPRFPLPYWVLLMDHTDRTGAPCQP